MSTIDPGDLPEHPGTIELECDECGEIFDGPPDMLVPICDECQHEDDGKPK